HPADKMAIAGVVTVGALVGLFGWAVDHTAYETWGGVLVVGVLAVVSIPLVRWAVRCEEDRWVKTLIPWAFALKLVSAVVRFAVVFAVYDGNADAATYHDAGTAIARQIRSGNVFPHVEGQAGTAFIKWLTGLVYSVTGPSELGGFFVFSWFGFWGLWFFYRAFVTACPEGDRHRYAVLVFFLPSLLFWPSSIGKEAWMTLGLGLAVWGAARLLTHRRGGLIAGAAGLFAVAEARPHIALILAIAILMAVLLRRPPKSAKITAPIGKLAVILVCGLGLIVVLNQTESFFELDTFNSDSVQLTLQRAARQTNEGGSSFDSGTPKTDFSPSRFPMAMLSVLFRPFPWEAHNAQAVIAAVEGSALLVTFVLSWRRVVGAVRSFLRTPYVLLCCVYSVVFIYGFASFANFGVLTRQRVQVLPLALVLVCLPPFHRTEEGGWRGLLTSAPAGTPLEHAPGTR